MIHATLMWITLAFVAATEGPARGVIYPDTNRRKNVIGPFLVPLY